MGTAAPPATPPRPVRNTASWSGTVCSSGQARLISQLTLISGGRSPIRHVGTRRVGDGRPTAEVEAVWPCQHFPDDQSLRLQTEAGEDDIIHLPSGLDRVDYERQEEEEAQDFSRTI